MASITITITPATVQKMMHQFLDCAEQHHEIRHAILRKAGLARLGMLDGEVHRGGVYVMNGVILRAWLVDDVLYLGRCESMHRFELSNPDVIELIRSTINEYTKTVMAGLANVGYVKG